MDEVSGANDADVIVASWHDPVRFEIIFARHFSTVFRFLAGRAGLNDAADLAADVFVRAFAHRRGYRPAHPSALPWLLGIAANALRERSRRLARAHRAHLRDAQRAGVPDFDGDDLDARVDAGEVAPVLREALESLTVDEYSVLVLAALHEFSYSEIARTLRIPIGTVRSRLARARRRVRELLEADRRISYWTADGGNRPWRT